jgi:hypothetical protein
LRKLILKQVEELRLQSVADIGAVNNESYIKTPLSKSLHGVKHLFQNLFMGGKKPTKFFSTGASMLIKW